MSNISRLSSNLSLKDKDQVGHFILRLAYCKSEDLRRWFLNQECSLLKFRLEDQTENERKLFIASNGLQFQKVDQTEVNKRYDVLAASEEISPLGNSNLEFFK